MDKDKVKVSIGDAEILPPWDVSIGDAEVVDPWEIDIGEAEYLPSGEYESDAVPPWEAFGVHPGLADIEGDNSFYLPGETMSDPGQWVTVGEAEIKDPWSTK